MSKCFGAQIDRKIKKFQDGCANSGHGVTLTDKMTANFWDFCIIDRVKIAFVA